MTAIVGVHNGKVADEVPSMIETQLSRPSSSQTLREHGVQKRNLETGNQSMVHVVSARKTKLTQEDVEQKKCKPDDGIEKAEHERSSDSDFQSPTQVMTGHDVLSLLVRRPNFACHDLGPRTERASTFS